MRKRTATPPDAGTQAAAATPKTKKKARLSGPQGDAKPYVPSIALRGIDGHITRTGTTVTAWYRLGAQRWSFRSDEERWSLVQSIAGQYADLQGRWLHIRVTSRPYPIPVWAESHIRNARNPLPDTPGALSFDDYMLGEQRQLRGRAMSDKEVYLGIEVSRRGLVDTLVDVSRPVLKRIAPAMLDAEVKALDAEIQHLDTLVATPGLQGRPATATEMRWLLERSCNLGLPASRTVPGAGRGVWSPEDLAALTEGSDAYQEPYAPTVTVRGRAGDLAEVERHVAVLSVGLMDKLRIPEHDAPWMQKADALGVPLEWSARIYVRAPEQVEGELVHQMGKVRSQVKHFVDEHEMEPPQDLARQAQRASDIEAEIGGQWGAQHTRVKGWWRVAVSGATRTDALHSAQALLQLYKPKVALEHPEAQYHMMREFIPGEPLASQAYLRRGSVTWAAAAVPTATASVGDRRGILLGETTGAARHPVAWDPWMAPETGRASGLTAIVAGLGGGKSFLGGGTVYKTLRTGAHWTILDPSGPLAALCELPELRPYARAINLLNAEPGILNPYRVVPEPQREHFEDTGTWRRERADAAATRRRLCQDVLLGILPYELARMPQTDMVIRRAVRQIGGAAWCHPGQVIDELRNDSTEHQVHAQAIYEALDDMRERLRPLIPEQDSDPYARTRDDRLTVLTMPGLVLPKDGASPENWTDAERLGAELLSLAGWLTQHMVYTGPSSHRGDWKAVRKGVWIDEAFFLSEVPAGRHLMDRFARDSRKWNVRVLLSSQVPSDFLRMKGFVSLVDSVFVGRVADHEAQSEALRLLQVPVGAGYEKVLSALAPPADIVPADDDGGHQPDTSPRQFIFSDGAGGVERIRIDFSGPHLAGLRDVLETTPGAGRTPERPALQAVLDHVHARGREDSDEPPSTEHQLAHGEAEHDTTSDSNSLGGVA